MKIDWEEEIYTRQGEEKVDWFGLITVFVIILALAILFIQAFNLI